MFSLHPAIVVCRRCNCACVVSLLFLCLVSVVKMKNQKSNCAANNASEGDVLLRSLLAAAILPNIVPPQGEAQPDVGENGGQAATAAISPNIGLEAIVQTDYQQNGDCPQLDDLQLAYLGHTENSVGADRHDTEVSGTNSQKIDILFDRLVHTFENAKSASETRSLYATEVANAVDFFEGIPLEEIGVSPQTSTDLSGPKAAASDAFRSTNGEKKNVCAVVHNSDSESEFVVTKNVPGISLSLKKTPPVAASTKKPSQKKTLKKKASKGTIPCKKTTKNRGVNREATPSTSREIHSAGDSLLKDMLQGRCTTYIAGLGVQPPVASTSANITADNSAVVFTEKEKVVEPSSIQSQKRSYSDSDSDFFSS